MSEKTDETDPKQLNNFSEKVGIGGAQFNGPTMIRQTINNHPSLLDENKRLLKLTIDQNLTMEESFELFKILKKKRGDSIELIFISKGSTNFILDGSDDALKILMNLYESGKLELVSRGFRHLQNRLL